MKRSHPKMNRVEMHQYAESRKFECDRMIALSPDALEEKTLACTHYQNAIELTAPDENPFQGMRSKPTDSQASCCGLLTDDENFFLPQALAEIQQGDEHLNALGFINATKSNPVANCEDEDKQLLKHLIDLLETRRGLRANDGVRCTPTLGDDASTFIGCVRRAIDVPSVVRPLLACSSLQQGSVASPAQ